MLRGQGTVAGEAAPGHGHATVPVELDGPAGQAQPDVLCHLYGGQGQPLRLRPCMPTMTPVLISFAIAKESAELGDLEQAGSVSPPRPALVCRAMN